MIVIYLSVVLFVTVLSPILLLLSCLEVPYHWILVHGAPAASLHAV